MRTNAASRKTGEEKGSGLFEEKENKWVVAGGSRGRGCCSSAPQRRAEGFRILFFFPRFSSRCKNGAPASVANAVKLSWGGLWEAAGSLHRS